MSHPSEQPIERALLFGVETATRDALWPLEDSLAELAQLAQSAGAQIVGTLAQRLPRASPTHYLGKGKVQELAALLREAGATTVICDDELTPLQQLALERELGVKVLDRTALILDIFSRRARTREGQLQVELAQHEYLLPRLVGQWSHLERLGGGIGTRGPGETQLETDRRLIRQRIDRLKGQIEEVRTHRALYRRRRRLLGLGVVALVGYTNAGKSTVLNALTHAQVLAEARPFATLDPTTRRLRLPSGREVLLTDTVGFIQKLPTSIVAAFRATLEELEEADLLLHIVDINHTRAREQRETVEDLLRELHLHEKPLITVANKSDLVGPKLDSADVRRAARRAGSGRGLVMVSAALGWGLERLLLAVEQKLAREMEDIAVEIPYEATGLLELFRRYGTIRRQELGEGGVRVWGKLPAHLEPRLRRYQLPVRGRGL